MRALTRRRRIDEYILQIHPLVLGWGRRMFTEGDPLRLRLVDTATTTTGVIIATYRPEDAE